VLDTETEKHLCQRCGSENVISEHELREMLASITKEMEHTVFPPDETPKPKFLN
jgi:hypothetical protein